MDEFDRKILNLMQRDCTLRAEFIADQIGLSASAVQRRIRNLRHEQIITAEVAVVDAERLGPTMTFIAGLEIARELPDAVGSLRAWAKECENIQQLYYVTGSVDLIAVIKARDVVAYDALATRLMAENPQIRRINTNVVLDPVKTGLVVPTGA
ncbi:Lrp/AsnC family transcriptional regulator [Albirhodobacter sp. R86504]|uniref:Lrp/AsnC family transcriptional regulator n=1 Tax=Albirhodobacter sp. R86504 TaxID=3093848 RepID=UPI00366A57C6